jgi:hypothetical protein
MEAHGIENYSDEQMKINFVSYHVWLIFCGLVVLPVVSACGSSECEADLAQAISRATEELEEVLGEVTFSETTEYCEYPGEAIFYFTIEGWTDVEAMEAELLGSPSWSEDHSGIYFEGSEYFFGLKSRLVDGVVKTSVYSAKKFD